MDVRLTTFLYLLMRDHVPMATVDRVIRDLPPEGDPAIFDVPELAGLAARLADRITPPRTSPEGRDEAEQWLKTAPMRCLEELEREREASGHGLTIDELVQRVGWGPTEDDLKEAQIVVQDLFDRGAVQRDSSTTPQRVLLTEDGKGMLEAWRAGGSL